MAGDNGEELWQQDLKIRLLDDKNDHDVVFKYLKEDFIPDEPIMWSLKLLEGSGFFDKLVHKDVEKLLVSGTISKPISVGAWNADGSKLVGLRLGQIFEKNKLPRDQSLRWMTNLPSALAPTRFVMLGHLQRLFDFMDYGPERAFHQVDSASGKIYIGYALGVSREMRGKGLGKELLRRSIGIAREQGCSHMYLMASGIYSQAIFKDAGFTLLNEKEYKDFKDRHGNQIIVHDVHKTNQLLYLAL